MNIIVIIVVAAVAFVAGALVGKRNPKKVAVADDVYKKVGQKVEGIVK